MRTNNEEQIFEKKRTEAMGKIRVLFWSYGD
jgi:hypothetical protein